MGTAVVADSRYGPRCDTVTALDARLVVLARGGAPLRRALARIAGEFVTKDPGLPDRGRDAAGPGDTRTRRLVRRLTPASRA